MISAQLFFLYTWLFHSHTISPNNFLLSFIFLKLSNRMIRELHFLLRLLTERKGRKDERKGGREGEKERKRKGGPFV